MSGPEIISRADAKARGLKRYFTGKPCKNGHLCQRECPSSKCFECIMLNHRLFYQRHKEAANERSRSYHQKNRMRCNRVSKEWRKKNPERSRYLISRWEQLNPEKVAQSKKRYSKTEKAKAAGRRRASENRRKDPAKYLKIKRSFYLNGPQNPKGELQWLRKNLVQLRNVRRLLRRLSRGQPRSPSSAFTTPTASPR